MTVTGNSSNFEHRSGSSHMPPGSIPIYRPYEHDSSSVEDRSSYDSSREFEGSDPIKHVLYKHTLHQMALVSDAIQDDGQQGSGMSHNTAATPITSSS
ncbi:hypothetical protein RUND412_001260 [Rhizina undulata]